MNYRRSWRSSKPPRGSESISTPLFVLFYKTFSAKLDQRNPVAWSLPVVTFPLGVCQAALVPTCATGAPYVGSLCLDPGREAALRPGQVPGANRGPGSPCPSLCDPPGVLLSRSVVESLADAPTPIICPLFHQVSFGGPRGLLPLEWTAGDRRESLTPTLL